MARLICGDNDRRFMRSADDYMCLYKGTPPEGLKKRLKDDDPVIDVRRSQMATIEDPDQYDQRLDPASYGEVEYRWSGHLLGKAHRWCADEVDRLFGENKADLIVVHNTFDKRWTMEPYFRLADAHEVRVHVLDMLDGGLSVHDLAERTEHAVPKETILGMRAGWEHDWRRAEKRPPWEVREEQEAIKARIEEQRQAIEDAARHPAVEEGGDE